LFNGDNSQGVPQEDSILDLYIILAEEGTCRFKLKGIGVGDVKMVNDILVKKSD